MKASGVRLLVLLVSTTTVALASGCGTRSAPTAAHTTSSIASSAQGFVSTGLEGCGATFPAHTYNDLGLVFTLGSADSYEVNGSGRNRRVDVPVTIRNRGTAKVVMMGPIRAVLASDDGTAASLDALFDPASASVNGLLPGQSITASVTIDRFRCPSGSAHPTSESQLASIRSGRSRFVIVLNATQSPGTAANNQYRSEPIQLVVPH